MPLVLILLSLMPLDVEAQSGQAFRSRKESFVLEEVASGLSNPWGMAWLPSGEMLVTERSGTLSLWTGGTRKNVQGVPPVKAEGQGGLLDVAVDPQFAQAPWIYLSYAVSSGGNTALEVSRGRLAGGALTDLQKLWTQSPAAATRVHYGGRLAFLPDGTLLISTGDRGSGPRAQNPADGAGKLVRIRRDGTVPPDNPILSGSSPGSFYSLGHRNIQGLAVHPQTGEIWATEHGPRGGDELNLLRAGKNYGWPVITHGVDYSGAKVGEGQSKPGLEQPVIWWTPSPAPSGLTWYTGDAFPRWKGNLFSGNLAGTHLLRMEIMDGRVVDQEKLLDGTLGRIRDVRTGPDGLLYLATDSPRGKIYRLRAVP